MKANPDKCHFLTSLNSEINITVENGKIRSTKFVKLLGVKFDFKLNLNSHVHDISKKTGQKINPISRVISFMDLNIQRLRINAFFLSPFNYCLILWICHNRTINSRTVNNNIYCLHKRCHRLIYSNKQSSFDDLFKKNNSVSIHHRNLQTLAMEVLLTILYCQCQYSRVSTN